MSSERATGTASVSTHILDTSAGRPAADVGVRLSVRSGSDDPWCAHAASTTDTDGRCKDLPDLPEGTVHARLTFEVEPYLRSRQRGTASGTLHDAVHDAVHDEADDEAEGGGGDGFFPEVTVAFAVGPGEHYHVPLLLNPYGYSVYRGS